MKTLYSKALESFAKAIASVFGLAAGLFILFGITYAAVTITTTSVTPGTPMTASLWNAVKTDLDNLAAEFNDIGNFNNVTLTSLAADDVLAYNGSEWINQANASGGGGGGALNVYDATDNILGYFLDVTSTFLYYWDATNKEVKAVDNRSNTSPNVITFYSGSSCSGVSYIGGGEDQSSAVGIGCTGGGTCTGSRVTIDPDSVARNLSYRSYRFTTGSCNPVSSSTTLRATKTLSECCSGSTCGLCDIKP